MSPAQTLLNKSNQIPDSNFEYQVIYFYYLPDLDSHKGFIKIGKTSISTSQVNVKDWKSIVSFDDSALVVEAAKKRNSYLKTASLNFAFYKVGLGIRLNKYNKLEIFDDKRFHDFLASNGVAKQSPTKNESGEDIGGEWYKLDPSTAIDLFNKYRQGVNQVVQNNYEEIVLREEQEKFVNETTSALKNFFTIESDYDSEDSHYLWDAIMRFGKTITAYKLVSRFNTEFKDLLPIRRVLILSHRTEINTNWKKDFNKVFFNDLANYEYGSDRAARGEKINSGLDFDSLDKNKNWFYFASIQNLRGRDENNSFKSNTSQIRETKWDLVIIDEAHEGNQTELAEEMHNEISRKFTIYLSGTPFKLLGDEYGKKFTNRISSWTYENEIEAKRKWDASGKPNNPYIYLPELRLFTIDISKSFKDSEKYSQDIENSSFDFRGFFSVDETSRKFKHEQDIITWLNMMSSDYDANQNERIYPYSKSMREATRHSLWFLPGVKQSELLEELLKNHPFFKHYSIENATGNALKGSENLEQLNSKIGSDASITKTITLTCGKLTTGVTVEQWTAVLMLANTSSAALYLQTAFRCKNPCFINGAYKKYGYIFDFAPFRALNVLYEYAGFTKERVSDIENVDTKSVSDILNYLPVISFDGSGLNQVNVESLFSALLKKVTTRIIQNGFQSPDVLNDEAITSLGIDKINQIISTTKLKLSKDMPLLVNDNNLADKEYGTENDSKPKTAKEVSFEEKTRRKDIDTLKKTLRAISSRLPLMILALESEQIKNFDIAKFIDFFDDQSWIEFMQSITKDRFKELIVYYNQKNLANAVKEWRALAQSAFEKTDFEMRVEDITNLFNYIKNPDKETVLTPAHVVSKHIKYSQVNFAEDYRKNPKTFKVIDLNSKTGLYPLKVAEIIWKSNNKAIPWRDIIDKHIYANCRTQAGYKIVKKVLGDSKNVEVLDLYDKYIKDADKLKIKKMKNHNQLTPAELAAAALIKKYDLKEEDFKFTHCISNPPYQVPQNITVENKDASRANNIFQNFFEIGTQLSDVTTMIFPAKWMTGGKGLDSFRHFILNSKHIKSIVDCPDYKNFFPTITLDSGLTIMTYDRKHTYEKTDYYTYSNQILSEPQPRKLNEYHVLIADIEKYSIIKTIEENLGIKNRQDWEKISFSSQVSKRKPYGIPADFFQKPIDWSLSQDATHSVKIHFVKKTNDENGLKSGRQFAFINPKEIVISKNSKWSKEQLIEKWKVCVPKARGGSRDERFILSKTIVIGPGEICSETYNVCGVFNEKDDAIKLSYFIESRVVRFLVSSLKLTQNAPSQVWFFVPKINIDNLGDWYSKPDDKSKRIAIDKEICKYLGLSGDVEQYIYSRINLMNPNSESIEVADDEEVD